MVFVPASTNVVAPLAIACATDINCACKNESARWQACQDINRNGKVNNPCSYNTNGVSILGKCIFNKFQNPLLGDADWDGRCCVKTPSSIPGQLVTPLSKSTYIGCYQDGAARILPNRLAPTDTSMTVEKCAAAAVTQNYGYFALQNGNECWAGNAFNPATQTKLADSQCAVQCRGKPESNCGGPWTDQVYAVTAPPAPIASKPDYDLVGNYIGCFKNTPAQLELLGGSSTNTDMTTSRCAALAAAKGYALYGVQAGRLCYGAAGKDTDVAKAQSLGVETFDKCYVPCIANADLSCGGESSIQLYRTILKFKDTTMANLIQSVLGSFFTGGAKAMDTDGQAVSIAEPGVQTYACTAGAFDADADAGNSELSAADAEDGAAADGDVHAADGGLDGALFAAEHHALL